MSEIQGFTSDKFTTLRAVLANQIDNGLDVGASISVIHNDEVVVDIWGGHSDEARTTPWERDTIVNVWSTTKTMTFLVALMLVDRNELDLFAPVARY
jgi:CubicO group peptidase (beta-lactamase class C family)